MNPSWLPFPVCGPRQTGTNGKPHDLFGVSFSGHPDLSPLLLYPEFEGYPGRKDYDFYDYREF